MKKSYADEFSIQVAGYPEGHPDRITKVSEMTRPLSEREKMRLVEVDGEQFVCTDENYAIELDYLKQKCDAGGDVIITQLFYDMDVFKAWVADLRGAGITAPIFPGIMIINAAAGFKRMTGFCKTRIPPAMAKKVAELSGDDKKEEFSEFGLQYITDLCKQLVASKLVPGLHFYCLNQSKKTFQVMERLGYYDTNANLSFVDSPFKSKTEYEEFLSLGREEKIAALAKCK